ncbi:hypothetical protein lerEdw1_014404 [Lerista edwardsae]|nr:hypothetical protein lerEdw1_014404 [Lerista edwardsae]
MRTRPAGAAAAFAIRGCKCGASRGSTQGPTRDRRGSPLRHGGPSASRSPFPGRAPRSGTAQARHDAPPRPALPSRRRDPEGLQGEGEAPQQPTSRMAAPAAHEELLRFLQPEARRELRERAGPAAVLRPREGSASPADLPVVSLPCAPELPLDLQYLPPEKQREPEPDIRKMLLEAILLLTATKPGRQLVRERGAYVILRELHKWETDPSALAACEKLVQVLIGDEPEAGMENLLEVAVPAGVEEQLQRLDREEEERTTAQGLHPAQTESQDAGGQ